MYKIIPFENNNEEVYAEIEKNNKAVINKVKEELTRLSKRGYILPNELSDIIDKYMYGSDEEESVLTPDDFLSDWYKEANKDEQRA